MKLFGLISILITTGLIAWWFSNSATGPQDTTPEPKTNYEKAIESAKETVDIIEGEVSLSSRAVFVYDGISVPDDIKNLDLSSRNLNGSLKAEIRHLQELRVLDLSDNNFTGMPAEIGQLSKLENLNLSDNPITGLPLELGNLHNLKILDLRGTQYSEYDLSLIEKDLPPNTQILIN